MRKEYRNWLKICAISLNRQIVDAEAIKVKSMSNRATITKYSYHGPFGEVSHSGGDYFAWQDGHLIGAYQTFEKAMEHLAWKERLKTKP
jgi:hypothetical protein